MTCSTMFSQFDSLFMWFVCLWNQTWKVCRRRSSCCFQSLCFYNVIFHWKYDKNMHALSVELIARCCRMKEKEIQSYKIVPDNDRAAVTDGCIKNHLFSLTFPTLTFSSFLSRLVYHSSPTTSLAHKCSSQSQTFVYAWQQADTIFLQELFNCFTSIRRQKKTFSFTTSVWRMSMTRRKHP